MSVSLSQTLAQVLEPGIEGSFTIHSISSQSMYCIAFACFSTNMIWQQNYIVYLSMKAKQCFLLSPHTGANFSGICDDSRQDDRQSLSDSLAKISWAHLLCFAFVSSLVLMIYAREIGHNNRDGKGYDQHSG